MAFHAPEKHRITTGPMRSTKEFGNSGAFRIPTRPGQVPLTVIASDQLVTNMYNEQDDSIDIIYKNGTVKDISLASDMLNIELLKKKVKKYYFAYLRS